jgi:hypothetical protein
MGHGTIREAIRALDAYLFVGRERELAMLRAWLLDETSLPSIVNISGRGGVGKSALLAAFRRLAEELGRPTLIIDGHVVEPTPTALVHCIATLLGRPGADLDGIIAELNQTQPVLIFDTFEQLGGLTRYLQEALLPALATVVRVVIAGRYPLGQFWSGNRVLGMMIRPMVLSGISVGECQTYLGRRGIASGQVAEQILGAAGGFPLALSLAADLATQHGVRNFPTAPAWRLAMRGLVEQLLREIDDQVLVDLIEVCAVVRQFDEAILEAVSGRPNLGAAFRKLCQLSVVQPAEQGLMLHDDVRRIVREDVRWRRADWYDECRRRALAYYRERTQQASPDERQRLLRERLFLWEDELIQSLLFEEQEPGHVWVEAMRAKDVDEVLAAWPRFLRVTLATAGGTLEQLTDGADPTFLRQVAAFFETVIRHPAAWRRVARDHDGQLVGFALHMPVYRDSLPLFEQHPGLRPLLDYYFTPRELAALPADPSDAQIWWLSSVAYSDVDITAARAAIMRDSVGLFARGGVFLGSTPLGMLKQLLEALGFERVPDAQSFAWGHNQPTDSFVLDLRQVGVEGWIEAIMAGQRPPRPLRPTEIERELRALLPHWHDDELVGRSALAEAMVGGRLSGAAARAAALRSATLRSLHLARETASDDDALALRAIELGFLVPDAATSRASMAARLAVSRRTLYRLFERGTPLLADALGAVPASDSCNGSTS